MSRVSCTHSDDLEGRVRWERDGYSTGRFFVTKVGSGCRERSAVEVKPGTRTTGFCVLCMCRLCMINGTTVGEEDGSGSFTVAGISCDVRNEVMDTLLQVDLDTLMT